MTNTDNTIPLWQDSAPGKAREKGEESYSDEKIFNVRNPALIPRPAPENIANGTAIIIFPGGGYERLSIIKEGEEVADWLNSLGISAFILKYRLKEFGHPVPLLDGIRAMRLLRSRAAEWNIDPANIGVLGFSAGGHLAASVASHFAEKEYSTDPVFARISARPAFSILIYPVISVHEPYVHIGSRSAMLGVNPSRELLDYYSNELHVTAETPPAFLVHGGNDQSVPVENSILYYEALHKAKVPVEMIIYQNAPHGFGLRKIDGPAYEWPKRCEEWLRYNGFVK